METIADSLMPSVVRRVLTVPMRNGNTEHVPVHDGNLYCSYRTYEEWKLSNAVAPLLNLAIGSYRTYEEWKRAGTRSNYKTL